MTDEKWLTTKEAAEHLGYSPYTLRRARLDGTLSGKEAPKATKSGKAVRYKKSDLDAWMTGDTEEAVSE
jgi:excisionase family DNA binding protein